MSASKADEQRVLAVLGAAGRTGKLVVERALAAGFRVNAFARESEKLARDPAVETFRGDARDLRALTSALRGVSAVVSVLGPTREPEVCSATTANVLSAARELGFRRYVVLSGAVVDAEGDDKGFMGKVLSAGGRVLGGEAAADKQRELRLLLESDLDWTLVRPPRLVDAPLGGGAVASLTRPHSGKIGRADLAEFLVRQVDDDTYVRKAPFVSA